MNVFKKFISKTLNFIIWFLKTQKHLYVKPLFIFLMSLIFIFSFVYIVKSYEPHNDYEDITIDFKDKKYDLKGIKVVIDPGHGGSDPGAPSYYGENESAIVMSVGEKLQKVLEESNAEVVMTRAGNETVELDDREAKGDIFISLHSDAFESNEPTGFTTFYAHDSQVDLATAINEGLDEHSLLPNKGVQTMPYQVIDQIKYPGTLVELGFLSNDVDDYLLNTEDYQNRLVYGIVEGIEIYVTEYNDKE